MSLSAASSERAAIAERPLKTRLGVGLIGFGTVGTGVYELIKRHPQLDLVGIVVRDASKSRPELNPADQALLSTDAEALLNNPALDILVEVAGGVEPTGLWVEEALKRGISVVSANKELLAKRGQDLTRAAAESGAALLFEAAVAGGIPILLPLKQGLAGNKVKKVAGILNGTTNYILTRMAQDGWTFSEALQQAQAKGFAEADPTSDIEGYDAAYKIALLASLAFGRFVDVNQLLVEGITTIAPTDIENARRFGYTIRLIGLAQREAEDGPVDVRVHPMLVENAHPLASINNEYNAIWVDADAVGDCMFFGKGAGKLPTASAVTGDLFALANDLLKGNQPAPSMQPDWSQTAELLPANAIESKFYLRLATQDLPGVIGEIGKVCGEFGVSLESVLQQPVQKDQPAQIVLITHLVNEASMLQALDKISQQETTRSVECLLRVL